MSAATVRPPSLYAAGYFDWCVHNAHESCPTGGTTLHGKVLICQCPCHEGTRQ
jgi:hypothetical protein